MWFEGPQTEWREYRGSESLREKSSAVLTKKRKKKTDATNICIICFTTYWVYFINKLWFAVNSEWFVQGAGNNYKENRPNFGSKRKEKQQMTKGGKRMGGGRKRSLTYVMFEEWQILL